MERQLTVTYSEKNINYLNGINESIKSNIKRTLWKYTKVRQIVSIQNVEQNVYYVVYMGSIYWKEFYNVKCKTGIWKPVLEQKVEELIVEQKVEQIVNVEHYVDDNDVIPYVIPYIDVPLLCFKKDVTDSFNLPLEDLVSSIRLLMD